jgi:hypothetical protein
MTNAIKPTSRNWWRWAAVTLAVTLVASWAGLGYLVLDGAISLDYCRVEQGHLNHDIRVLVEAAKGRLDASTFVEARARIDPELPRRLDEDDRLGLESVSLQFGKGGALQGLVSEGS